jgi:hypothetical protein
MSFVSRIHDEATEVDVTYGSDRAVVTFRTKPATAAQLRDRAEALATPE